MQVAYEGLKKQGYACDSFLRLLRCGTEEHAVGVIRRLRAGTDVGTILEESLNHTSTSSATTCDTLHSPNQDHNVTYQSNKYGGTQHGNPAAQCRREARTGKAEVLQEIVDYLT